MHDNILDIGSRSHPRHQHWSHPTVKMPTVAMPVTDVIFTTESFGAPFYFFLYLSRKMKLVISLESPLAGRLVKSAPEPWNDAAVTITVTFTPVAVTIPLDDPRVSDHELLQYQRMLILQ